MADDVEMEMETDMATILTSFSNLHFVLADDAVPEADPVPEEAVPESMSASWTHREVPEVEDEDDEEEEVKSALDPAASPNAAAVPRWLFTRTPWTAGAFDYGIMTRSRPVRRAAAATTPPREQSHLPSAFMLASNMLSIRDPWEEAAANGYFELTKKRRTASSVLWLGAACAVTAAGWAYGSGACAGMYACLRESVAYPAACRVFFLFE